MSLPGIFGPTLQALGNPGGLGRTDTNGAAIAGVREGRPARDDAARPGGGAVADRTQAPPAVRDVPPVAAARRANSGSGARAGADGDDAVTQAREARADRDRRATSAAVADEVQARRYVEAAQDRLIAQEILSRIPVPVEALPRLTQEAERTSQERVPEAGRYARSA